MLNLLIGELGRSLTAGRIRGRTHASLWPDRRLNPALNAVITLTAEQARGTAAADSAGEPRASRHIARHPSFIKIFLPPTGAHQLRFADV